MSTLNMSLPESMRAFILSKVAEGGYSTASEYIRGLVREDQKRTAEERIEALLLEGLDSGDPVEISDQWWQRKKAEMLERLKEKRDA
ncbi:MAG: type II toxin-antitoxin system ParD family antitoxin [Candidatus Nealsonbacteria bacterium]|nr:type II toxin-antitoxin system ParD family antitoxin [Candidatus Nealsonbacteria bacterium]